MRYKISDLICELNSECGNITINTRIYNIEAIHSATYQFTDYYHILTTPADVDSSVIVIFEAKDVKRDIGEDIKDFINALIDYQVRYQLDKNNGKIRNLIVEHAFSPLNLHKEIDSK